MIILKTSRRFYLRHLSFIPLLRVLRVPPGFSRYLIFIASRKIPLTIADFAVCFVRLVRLVMVRTVSVSLSANGAISEETFAYVNKRNDEELRD